MSKNKDIDNWFLQIECFDPHEPFHAPKRFKELFPTNYDGPILDWPIYDRVKETREEIDTILAKLENQETNLNDSIGDYQRLILLNKHVDELFKKKFKEITDKK